MTQTDAFFELSEPKEQIEHVNLASVPIRTCSNGVIEVSVGTDGPVGGDSSQTLLRIRAREGGTYEFNASEQELTLTASGDWELEGLTLALEYAASELRDRLNRASQQQLRVAASYREGDIVLPDFSTPEMTHVLRLFKAGIEEEREECAMLCETLGALNAHDVSMGCMASSCAIEIRKRAKKP